jgi:hypothetical protein
MVALVGSSPTPSRIPNGALLADLIKISVSIYQVNLKGLGQLVLHRDPRRFQSLGKARGSN